MIVLGPSGRRRRDREVVGRTVALHRGVAVEARGICVAVGRRRRRDERRVVDERHGLHAALQVRPVVAVDVEPLRAMAPPVQDVERAVGVRDHGRRPPRRRDVTDGRDRRRRLRQVHVERRDRVRRGERRVEAVVRGVPRKARRLEANRAERHRRGDHRRGAVDDRQRVAHPVGDDHVPRIEERHVLGLLAHRNRLRRRRRHVQLREPHRRRVGPAGRPLPLGRVRRVARRIVRGRSGSRRRRAARRRSWPSQSRSSTARG